MNSNLEVADIFNEYSHQLKGINKDQSKVIQAIKNCRTSVLGGHKVECDSCDYEKHAYNSCRNRHCPKCGFIARTKWIGKRSEDLFDCQYFHTVFTLPGELREVMLRNKRISYDILFKSSSETLKEVAMSKKYLGADIGFIGVLHTWGQNLVDHPHVHYLIPGGGLRKESWIKAKKDYFLPVKVLSKVFRGKVLDYFERAFESDELVFSGTIKQLESYIGFKDLLLQCSDKDFVVYAKKPFLGPKEVLKYLGKYTHRIAISNYRLVKLEDGRVYFKVRDKKNPGESKVISLTVAEFMRRFLMHVLPRGYVRIRHFGILGNRFKKVKIDLIRRAQGIFCRVLKLEKSLKDIIEEAIGVDIDSCPDCEAGLLIKKSPFTSKFSSA